MKQDLERFPRSETAQRMLSRVSPIYDQSYVAKWLYEVMGTELDEVREQVVDLRLQAFAETATWAMDYWEARYGIETDARLDLETRRSHVIAKRDTRVPMNPARLEKILADLSGREFIVTENVAPYVFLVEMLDGRNEVDYKQLLKLLKNIKPSHQNFLLDAVMDVIEWENANDLHFFDLGLDFQHSFYNFGRYVSFDGERYFDGSLLFDQEITKKLHFYEFCVALAVQNKMSMGQLLEFAAAFQNSNHHHFQDLQFLSRFLYRTALGLDDVEVGIRGPKHDQQLQFADLALKGFAAQTKSALAGPVLSLRDQGWWTDKSLDFGQLRIDLNGRGHHMTLQHEGVLVSGLAAKTKSHLEWPAMSLLDQGWQTENALGFEQLQTGLIGPTHALAASFQKWIVEGFGAKNESGLRWPALFLHTGWSNETRLIQHILAIQLQTRYLGQLLRMAAVKTGELPFTNESVFQPQQFFMKDQLSYQAKSQMPTFQMAVKTSYNRQPLTGSLTKDSRHYMDGSRYFNGAIPFHSEYIEEDL